MLKVVISFNDLQDNGYFYGVGDTYPRRGYKPTHERVKSLMSADNARRVPLIAGTYEEPKTDIVNELKVKTVEIEAEAEETKPKRKSKTA